MTVPPGVGKTHLAIALGIKAVEAGYSVLFLTLDMAGWSGLGMRTGWSARSISWSIPGCSSWTSSATFR